MKRSCFEIKKDARAIVKPVFVVIVLTMLIYLAIFYLMNLLLAKLSGYDIYLENFERYYTALMKGNRATPPGWPKVEAVALLLAGAVFLMIFVLRAGFSRYVMCLSRGEVVGLQAIFGVFAYFDKVVIIGVLTSVLISLGFTLFFVPGLILLYRYRLTIFVMYDNPELRPVECMRKSAQIMRGNKMRCFLLDLSFIGWKFVSNVLTSQIAIPLLEFWLTPYMGVAGAVFYNDLVGVESKAPQMPEQFKDNDE